MITFVIDKYLGYITAYEHTYAYYRMQKMTIFTWIILIVSKMNND